MYLATPTQTVGVVFICRQEDFFNSMQIINQPVILSGVELSPSEKRGESKAPKRRRDLVWNFGGFLMGCYISNSKPPKLVKRSRRRIRSSVLDRIVA